MKFSAAVSALCVIASTQAFAPTSTSRSKSIPLFAKYEGQNTEVSLMSDRRAALATLSTAFIGGAGVIAPFPASASLLDEFGADPTKINQAPPVNKAPVVVAPKSESSIEPNLRSNYYYPTNKKRYLPRIKKCSDALPQAAAMIGEQDWEGASDFALKIADDTVLPMKLYTSSLSGGGTNVKVSYLGEMEKAAKDFEKGQKALVKALGKKDQQASSKALEQMAEALQAYRTSGKLLGPDGGGDIPSVDEIRRSACRVQGRSFEKKILDRDARVKST
mmetsp:Transcript_28207/g.40883  ORF Transcript_28207/g.40883 Transcript_28207/m.40883 type:complete len:276 (+) Transcript_28207:40-867(+)